MTILIEGKLEIDQQRGVIYFHSKITGHSALRICSLPKPIPDPSKYGDMLDISHMVGCSWRKEGTNESNKTSKARYAREKKHSKIPY